MNLIHADTVLLALASSLLTHIHCGNVLVLCPVSSPSHKNVIEPIFTGLAERGHNLTIVSSIKTKPHANITDVIPFDNFDYFPNLSALELRRMGVLGAVMFDYNILLRYCESVYQYGEFLDLLEQKFDLVLIDLFFNECLMGFAYKTGAPLVLVAPLPAPGAWTSYIGNRLPTSFVPEVLKLKLTTRMNLLERVTNTMMNLAVNYGVRRPYPTHESIYRKYLGQDIPSLDELMSNMSLILSNSHFSFNGPRPTLPDIVEIGGAHCRPGKPLPKELADFANEAKDGLILFSLGSIVKPHDLPEHTRKAFLSVFSRLKQRVLWKWPKDMADLPSNVKLSKWIPQQDVLAHSNTRIFITHSGLLSTQEAIYHQVPIVSVPVFGDQDFNANLGYVAGIGVTIEIIDVTEENIEEAINELLTNTSYLENVKRISLFFRDQPQTPKDRAVYWAEYVMRHKGAKQLRSAARELNFFQYYLIDVMTLMFTFIAVILFVVCLVLRVVLRIAHRTFSAPKPKAKIQ